ncbi:MAG: ribosome-associated translation inhibitor RaiA [Pontimonas sp.]|nr:ribosome-associated translation inhibitor RaiA [Pontimonas sp.]MCF8548302.1 ribosome-associated translation inhibitor RaiA [Pontimonas sp.]
MDITLAAQGVVIPDRFRDYVDEKADKVLALAERAQTFQVKVSRENSSRGHGSEDIVELTVIGKGPVIRAEAKSSDKYAAFDEALDHLIKRLRRAKDKKLVHHGRQRPEGLSELASRGFSDIDVTPASVEVLRSVATGSIPTLDEHETVPLPPEETPVVIRRKVFEPQVMTAEEAVDQMELVGHDFFLFVDATTNLSSVVYRRKGWNYGVIALSA